MSMASWRVKHHPQLLNRQITTKFKPQIFLFSTDGLAEMAPKLLPLLSKSIIPPSGASLSAQDAQTSKYRTMFFVIPLHHYDLYLKEEAYVIHTFRNGVGVFVSKWAFFFNSPCTISDLVYRWLEIEGLTGQLDLHWACLVKNLTELAWLLLREALQRDVNPMSPLCLVVCAFIFFYFTLGRFHLLLMHTHARDRPWLWFARSICFIYSFALSYYNCYSPIARLLRLD